MLILLICYTGYSVSNATFNGLVMRYSDVDGKVTFDNFVACIARLSTMFCENVDNFSFILQY